MQKMKGNIIKLSFQSTNFRIINNIMFQFFNSFRSEKKLDHQKLHRTHNLEEKTPSLCQTDVKSNHKQYCQNMSHQSDPNDKIHFSKKHQNPHEHMLKRQFFTLATEIELDGEKYKLLKICSDGQFMDNFINGGNSLISEECHLAVVKKVTISKTEYAKGSILVSGGNHESFMSQDDKSQAYEQTDLNQDFKCVVFTLKFNKATQPPVKVLHKSSLMSLFEFFSETQKESSFDQKDGIKKLANCVEKTFDDQEWTLKLVKDRQPIPEIRLSKQNDENKFDRSQSYKYRFRSYEDLLSIKFFIVDQLKKLVKMNINEKTKDLKKELQNKRFCFRSDEKEQIKREKLEQKEKKVEEKLNKEHISQQQPSQSQLQQKEQPINKIDESEEQKLIRQLLNFKQSQQFYQIKDQYPCIYALTHQKASQPFNTENCNAPEFQPKKQLQSFSQFQSSQMFQYQASSNAIQKTQAVEPIQSQKIAQKNQDYLQQKLWQKQNALTYENLPGEGVKKEKYQLEPTLSNQKTIPEKCSLDEEQQIERKSQINNPSCFQEVEMKQNDLQHSLRQERNDQPMIDEHLQQYDNENDNISSQSERKISKNPQFQQTTINQSEKINQNYSFNVQPQSIPINYMQSESEKIVPKKLTFPDIQVESRKIQPMNQEIENHSSIQDYRIEEQMQEEIGGYESEDFSQEIQEDSSQANKSIQNKPQKIPLLVHPMEEQLQNHSLILNKNHGNLVNSQLFDSKAKSQTDNKNFQKLAPETHHSLSIHHRLPQQNHLQEKYEVLYYVVKTQKIIKLDQQQLMSSTVRSQLQILQNTDYSRSTYSLVRNSQKSILCLQILKQQGKVYKPPTNEPKSKDDLIKLMLYNPLLLQKSESSHDYNKFLNIKSFRQALHNVNSLTVSSNQQHILLYSTLQHSHPVVLEYNTKQQKFTGMFKIPSLCHKSGLTKKPFPLIKVQYLSNNESGDFCAISKKQICLFKRNASKNTNIQSNSELSEQTYHKVFVYRNLFSDKKSNEYEFDTFELHESGRYLVAGLNGRYIRVFDLEKQQEDQSMSEMYQQNRQKDRNLWKSKQQRKKVNQRKMKTIRWQQTDRKTKRIKRTNKPRKTTKLRQSTQPKLIAHNHDKYKVYYLKSLNSFDLEDQQNISPVHSQQLITPINPSSDENQAQSTIKINTIKLIYETLLNQKETQISSRKVTKIYCSRDDGRQYLINCVEESPRMGIVNCFENKLRISNRSLIRVIAEDEAKMILMKE